MPRRAGRDSIYAAARVFVDRALRKDDSLFTPGVAIWTLPHLDDLHRRFNEHPDLSPASFEEKFEAQLAGAPGATIQLAGELFFFHLLIAGDMKGATKRALIDTVLNLSDVSVSLPDDLGDGADVYREHDAARAAKAGKSAAWRLDSSP